MPDTAPPALANPPQFAASYWDKVPRKTISTTIHKVEAKDGWKEFTCGVGSQPMRFRRKAEEITQLIMPGTPVHVEVIHNELVTGMYLPDIKAWAFRMTNQELADYAREISGQVHAQRLAARELMLETVAEALLLALDDLGLIIAPGELAGAHEEYQQMARHLALVAIGALETGPDND